MTEESAQLKVGDDLYVVMVDVTTLRERDVNAQVLQPRHMERLTENIRSRGQIESLPYVHCPSDPGQYEIVSGHHRVRAAVAAGITRIPVVLDKRKMRESEVIAKQISFNEIHGSPDEDILRQMIAKLDNVDDMLTTGLPEDMLPTVDKDDTKLLLPAADFDWRMVTLTFLPGVLGQFDEAVKMIDKHSEIVGVARRDQFEGFAKACHTYGLVNNIRSMSTVIAAVTAIAQREILDSEEYEPGEREWVETSAVVGQSMPAEGAVVVRQAINRMLERGEATHPWQALEFMAANYLSEQ